MADPFFTIGHSTRSIDEFVGMLAPNGVQRVIDVRAIPRSRTNPQYNRDVLPGELAPHGIGYVHVAELGGLRGRHRPVADDLNGYWDNASFRNYADYALTPPFREGFERLLESGQERRVAIMCAEAVWWRCHRRIIADYLLAADKDVWHLMGPDTLEPARMTPAARPGPDGGLVYPFTLA